jgi:hypothetical protein
MRFAFLPLLVVPLAVACASTVPKAELDRCKLGVADGNDAYTVRQPAACRMVAQRLAADEEPAEALGFARKACDLQDAAGCEQYLALVRGQPSLAPGELQRARAAGEKACDGIVVSTDGTDPRPVLCARTAEIYQDLEPTSRSDAARLFARACKLGDDRSCAKARADGAEPEATSGPGSPAAKSPPPRMPPPSMPAPLPPPTSTVVSQVVAPPCHEMRGCVALDVQQMNAREESGTITNHCDHTVACKWCPSHGQQVEKTLCHSGTLTPGETRTGKQWGLWYEGYDGMGYDCMDEHDVPGCLAL